MKLPQLSLRELFLWVLVLALILGWWLDRQAVIADLSDKLAEESASLQFIAGAMMAHLVNVEGKHAEWSRDEVIIDGKTYSRSDWIDPVEAEKAAK